MAKWQGTIVPNSGYVGKVYFNTNLSADEVVDLLSKLETNENNAGFILVSEDSLIGFMYLEGTYGILNSATEEFYFISNDLGWGFVGWNTAISYPLIINNNVVNSFQMEGNNFVSGTQNNLITELFSITPFVKIVEETTADKLQKLIDGKQYVVDKTNAKAETSLPINCTWEELGDTIEGIKGSGSSNESTGSGSSDIVIPSVSNLTVNENGVASWDKPDFSSMEGLDYTYTYIVSVNDKEIETTDTSKDLSYYLNEGTNIVSVVIKATITLIKNSNETSKTIEYSLPSYAISFANATLPTILMETSVATIGTNIYIFGGNINGNGTNAIYKFDTTTETITTLDTTLPYKTMNTGEIATMGTNVYIFGGRDYNTILKFDTTTETITTLDTTLPTTNYDMGVATIGTNVYLFGGNSYKSTIYKFDMETETITTLDTTLSNNGAYSIGASSYGTNVYLFGGIYKTGGRTNLIYKFDTTTETITKLSVAIPIVLSEFGIATIGTNTYLFGGASKPYGNGTNTIYKFDMETETITTLDTTLPETMKNLTATTIGTNVYLFGGYYNEKISNVILKFTT